MTVLRQAQEVVEALVQNTPKLILAQEALEALVSNTAKLVLSQVVIEALVPVTAPIDDSLTIAGSSAVSVLDGIGYPVSLTVAGSGAVTLLDGTGYFSTLSVDGSASVAQDNTFGIGGAVTIAGVADIAMTGGYGSSLTIDGVAAISVEGVRNTFVVLTVAGVADIFSPGGVVYFANRSIDWIAGISVLDGLGYFDTLDIDGISDIAQAEEYIKNELLTIAGISDVTQAGNYTPNAPLTIAGISAFAYVDNVDAIESTSFSSAAFIGVENIYEVLYGTQAIAGIAVVGEPFKNNSQQPAAQGSVSVECTGVFNRTVTQTLSMSHEATFKKPTAISSQTLSMSQQAVCQRIRAETVTQTLSMTHEAEAARGAVQTLVFGQSVTVVKVMARTVTQTLVMTQSGDRNTVLNRSVSQTLVFNVASQKSTPMIGSQGGGNQTLFQYNQPFVNVVIKPKNCLVTIGVPSQTVILPCPIFGDTQNYTGELNLKKTMTGDTYTYVKRTETERLRYTFQIGTYKAIELRQFLLDHSHELITMRNWKGETWFVFLVNNPFEFSHAARWQPKGERVDITLEFEGVRT